MLVLLVCAAIYFVVGLLFDLFVHMTNAIIYWDRQHALKSHLYLIALWPLALLSAIIHRFGRSAIIYTATALALALGLAIVVWAGSAKHVLAQAQPACITVDDAVEWVKQHLASLGADGYTVALVEPNGDVVLIASSPAKPTALHMRFKNGCFAEKWEKPVGTMPPVLAPSQNTPA